MAAVEQALATASIEGDRPTFREDHADLQVEVQVEVLDPVIAVAPGGRARLRLSRNCVASEIRGEAQVISPYDTWGYLPWTQGFAVAVGGETALRSPSRRPLPRPARGGRSSRSCISAGRSTRSRSRSRSSPHDARTVTDPIRFGVLAWPQYTDWPSLLQVGRRVEELGYDALWT